MTELIISPEAEQDLIDIWRYIASDHVDNADRFLDRLYQKAYALLEHPRMGIERSLLALRSVVVGRYVLFYRIDDDRVEVVRVIHSSRDVPFS